MKRCKKCGRYNDPSEWPEEMRADYDPDLCYVCTRHAEVDAADEAEEEDVEIDDDPEGIAAQEESDKAFEEPEEVDGDEN